MSTRSKCCIIGVPDHLGVIHVGGRIGAARGPEIFRKYFCKMKGKISFQDQIQDAGDSPVNGFDIQENHKQAADFISLHHRSTSLSVIVGGGHDHGYSHLLGIYTALSKKKAKPKLGCINIDAHLDVRKPNPVITSGSPFYLALESKILDPKRFVEFGIQSHCNSPELWKYIDSKKVRVIPFSKLRLNKAIRSFQTELKKLSSQCDAIVISLDLDAVASAFAPGVSAPQAEGFSPSEILEMLEFAGTISKVVSLGIFELNPEHDTDGKTARLAATAAYHFLESAILS